MPRHKETDVVLTNLQRFRHLTPNHSIKEITHPIQAIEVGEPCELVLKRLQGDWLQKAHGYFANARNNSAYATLDNEYKVQDLLYLQLIDLVPDLQYENPNGKNKGALTSTRIDLFSKQADLFIEAKLASSKHDAKKVESEISEDLVRYGQGKNFKNLIFFIYCHNYSFPSKVEFSANFTSDQSISGHKFKTFCIIKP